MRANRNKRRAERYATAKPVEVAIAGEDMAYPAVLMDVSPTGFKATVEGQIAAGTQVELRIGEQAGLSAHTMWQRDDLVGCEFAEKLSRHAVLTIARSGLFGSTASPSA